VIGGHEHYPITATEGRALISKAGSDARWVARIDVNKRREGIVERFYELVPMTGELPDEPRTGEIVSTFEARLGTELDVVVGETRTPLDADETHLRASETNIGNLFADAMRADTAADIAIMNAGSIRGNRIYPAGPLTRRTLLAMHPFGNAVCKISVAGSVVLAALNSGVSKLPATAGQFPQVSGLTMQVDARAPPGQRVRDVIVNGQRLDPVKSYVLAIPDYLLKGGDGYTMFANARVLVDPESGSLLVSALEKYVMSRGTIASQVEGRMTIVR
jgi:2',3'-cyclic-nucleotide 2'-phosphodiesterase (5'-nucleotidase family)